MTDKAPRARGRGRGGRGRGRGRGRGADANDTTPPVESPSLASNSPQFLDASQFTINPPPPAHTQLPPTTPLQGPPPPQMQPRQSNRTSNPTRKQANTDGCSQADLEAIDRYNDPTEAYQQDVSRGQDYDFTPGRSGGRSLIQQGKTSSIFT